MSVLVNRDTGLAEEVPEQLALASGQYEVPLNDPQGNPVTTTLEEAKQLVHQGYTQPKPEQLQNLLKYSQHSTTKEQVKTGLEGAAAGATFGLSTGIETAMGVPEEDIRARREVNPVSHGVGELAGLGASMAVGVGEGAILAKIGTASVRRIAPLVGASAIGRVGTTAAKLGIENMVFQSGDEVSKMFTHDPDQSVGTAAADIGLSGLIGAALGGLGQGGAELWRMGPGKKVDAILKGIVNKTSGLSEEVKNAAGIEIAPELQAALNDNPHAAELFENLIKSNSSSAEKAKIALQGFHDKVGEALKATLDKPGTPKAAMPPEMQEWFSTFKAAQTEKPLEDSVRKIAVENLMDSSLKSGEFDTDKFFKAVDKLTPDQHEMIFDQEASNQIQALRDLSNKIPTKLPPKLSEAEAKKIWNELPAAAVGIAAELMNHSGPAAWLVAKLGGYVKKEAPDAVRLAMLKFLGSPEAVSSQGFRAAVSMAQSVIRGEKKLNGAVGNVFNLKTSNVSEPSKADIDKLDKQVRSIAEDESQLMKGDSQLGHYLPEQGSAAALSSMRAIQYLSKHRPTEHPGSPLDSPRPVSAVQEATYRNALRIAQNPLVVLEHIKKGDLTIQDIGHLRSMYPQLYDRMSQKVTNDMITSLSKGHTIPYKTKMGLSLFLSQPLTSSMTPESLQVTHFAMLPKQRGQQGEVGNTPSKSEKLSKLPGMVATSEQRKEQHRMK